MDAYNAFNDYDFQLKRQNGMAPSRQIDMAPLNLPGIPTPKVQSPSSGGGIDDRISQLEGMFANVRVDRPLSQAEITDMNQKRQILDNLYRIRESSQSRALADEERKQKIENLRMVGEKAKQDKREAQLAKARQIPSTFVTEQMGGNPYVPAGAGLFIDSQGRKAAVPAYGTVTPAMYGKLGTSRMEGTASPTAQDFQPTDSKYAATEKRIEQATQQGDYGKAAMLAQQQINNLAQIAAMPNLAPEAKAAIVTQIENLANQSKQNAVMAQQQIKSNADIEKIKANAEYQKGEQERKLFETSAKFSQETKKALSKAYFDAWNKVYEVPSLDVATGQWRTKTNGEIFMEEKTISQMTPAEREQVLEGGSKMTADQIANTLAYRSMGMEPPSQLLQPKQPNASGWNAFTKSLGTSQGQPPVFTPAPAQTAPPAGNVQQQKKEGKKEGKKEKVITVKANPKDNEFVQAMVKYGWIDNPEAALNLMKTNPNLAVEQGISDSQLRAILNGKTSQDRLEKAREFTRSIEAARKRGEKVAVKKTPETAGTSMDYPVVASTPPIRNPMGGFFTSLDPSMIQSGNKTGYASPTLTDINEAISEAQNLRSGLPSNYVPSTPSDLRVRPANTVDAQNAILSAGSFNPTPLVMSNLENGIQLQSPNPIISPEAQRDFLIQLLAGIKDSFVNKRRNVKPTY